MEFIIETERLLIRPVSLADMPVLTDMLGDPEVMKYSVRGVYDEAATLEFVKWCLACYESHGVGPWALVEKASCALIGFCGVAPERVGDAQENNLGYRLARQYWGAGFATEAARGVLDYAFGVKEVGSVVVLIDPEHVASMRVAEKAGFHSFRMTRFHGRDVRLYRMTREAWLGA